MATESHTRRKFLMQSGLAVGGLAAAPQLLSRLSAVPPTRLRGLMVDAARVPESLAYYRRVIDFCEDWKLNALQFRVADDQGCALRFSSVPDLCFHEHAFAPEQLHDLAQYAHSRGVDLIPELESFGHTGYITRSRAYAHLLDADSQQSSEFTGIIPVHPETLQLFSKLYREVAEVFPSIYLHGGCDEVNWGGSSLSRKALQTKQRYEIWAEYLNSLDHVAGSLEKQFIVWGDMVVHKEPRILERLNKSIIVMDWNYTETSSAKLRNTLSTIRTAGCRAIGAPALISYRVGPRAGRDQLANIDAFADAYLGSKDGAKGLSSLGVILTNWVPSRYIQNSIWDGFAYAAFAFSEGKGTAQKSAFQRFVERHYDGTWNHDWDEVFQLIYQAAPQVHEQGTPAEAVPLRAPWSNDEQLSAVTKIPSSVSNPFTPIRTLLEKLERVISKNVADFKAFSLSVRYLEHAFWRDRVVGSVPRTHEYTDTLIKQIAERDRALAEALLKDWDQGRFADSAGKLQPLYGFEPKDQLVFQFQRGAEYSASLASHPERFLQLLVASRRAQGSIGF
jgi:hypothetical protein